MNYKRIAFTLVLRIKIELKLKYAFNLLHPLGLSKKKEKKR